MSNKKKIITPKDLSHELGSKTPTQYVSGKVGKKHGHYKILGSKAEKKIVKAACQHHIVDKHGKLRPAVEYTDSNKYVRCMICGAVFQTKFFEDNYVQKTSENMNQIVAQAKMFACAIGADRDTSTYLTSLNIQTSQISKVYGSLRAIAEKVDRSKKKKKNKKKKHEMGGWYQA